MKKIFLLLLLLFAGVGAFNQTPSSWYDNGYDDPAWRQEDVHMTYTVDVSEFCTNAGFFPSTSINFSAITTNKKKGLTMGFFFDTETFDFSGLNPDLFWYLTGDNGRFTPYFFYDIIFRRSHVPEVLPNGLHGQTAAYNSVEHHAGLGVKCNLSKKFFLQASSGPGFYLGSIKKPSKPDPRTDEIHGTGGFGYMVKFAIGYVF